MLRLQRCQYCLTWTLRSDKPHLLDLEFSGNNQQHLVLERTRGRITPEYALIVHFDSGPL